jgi:hypothetical protein
MSPRDRQVESNAIIVNGHKELVSWRSVQRWQVAG